MAECERPPEGDQGQPGTWAWIGVGDVEALYEEYKAKGANILRPPETILGRVR